MIKKINDFICKRGMIVFTIFLFIQPILDMMLGIFSEHNIVSALISGFKILFMIFCITYIYFIKKSNIKYVLFLILYSIIFLLVNFAFKGGESIFVELKILTKNIFMPITLIFIINLFRKENFKIKYIYIIFFIYLALIFIPNILNIGFNSYSYAKLGSVGFFYSANAIGSIISILFPILVEKFIVTNNKLKLILFLIVYFYILVTIGTKAPILCALIVMVYYLILFIINSVNKKNKLRIFSLLMFIIIMVIISIKIFPLTPFYKNLVIHLKFLNINSISDLFTFKNFDHFIFSARLTCFKDAVLVFSKSHILQKLFGVGYIISGSLYKTSEMDYLVTLIHQGLVGFIILYYLYFKVLFLIFKEYIKGFKLNFKSIKRTSILISLVISVLCAFLSGHVLETPSVCIFVMTIIGIALKEFKIKE